MSIQKNKAELSGTQSTLVMEMADWLTDRALDRSSIETLFVGMCDRLLMIGVPLWRVSMTWPALHPMIEAERLLWNRGRQVEHEMFDHDEVDKSEWMRSPLKHLLDSDGVIMRRRLTGAGAMRDFELLEDLAQAGATDYFAIKTYFSVPRVGVGTTGCLISWVTDRSGGFTDDDIATLGHVQRLFAVAFKMAIQMRITETICDVYLGPIAGRRVLDGEIRRGDGASVDAVVWYSDMRGSTHLAEILDRDAYLGLLNTYFECTAGAVAEVGGEVLDFIGDAVLAIFPLDGEASPGEQAQAAVRGAEIALKRAAELPKKALPDAIDRLEFGIGIARGEVMFGNIGVPDRLAFSVIGPTVNEVARLEAATKMLDVPVIMSSAIVDLVPEDAAPLGAHRLAGITEAQSLYCLKPPPR